MSLCYRLLYNENKNGSLKIKRYLRRDNLSFIAIVSE